MVVYLLDLSLTRSEQFDVSTSDRVTMALQSIHSLKKNEVFIGPSTPETSTDLVIL